MDNIETIKNALTAFQTNTGIRISLDNCCEQVHTNNLFSDIAACLEWGNHNVQFLIEYKKNVNRASVAIMAMKFAKSALKGLVVTDYITPTNASLLKKLKINYIDGTGNAYISEFPIYIEIKGCKRSKSLQAQKQMRLFKSSGMKVIFALLYNPSLTNDSYREICRQAGVSLGSVDWIMKDLETSGYMIKVKNGKRVLKKKQDLLRRWVEAYPEQLRPKLVIGKYEHLHRNKNWWKEAGELEENYFWGGEVASEMLTKYLKSETVTIYCSNGVNKFVAMNHLRKSSQGYIELLEKFWNFETDFEKNRLVPPLLIYADLLASRNSRNIETAEIIYEKFIAEYIGEA